MFYPCFRHLPTPVVRAVRLVKAKRQSKTGVEAENSVESKQQESWGQPVTKHVVDSVDQPQMWTQGTGEALETGSLRLGFDAGDCSINWQTVGHADFSWMVFMVVPFPGCWMLTPMLSKIRLSIIVHPISTFPSRNRRREKLGRCIMIDPFMYMYTIVYIYIYIFHPLPL